MNDFQREHVISLSAGTAKPLMSNILNVSHTICELESLVAGLRLNRRQENNVNATFDAVVLLLACYENTFSR